MQGIGSVIASILAFILINSVERDYAWRICLGFGAVLAMFLVYPRYRFHIKNTQETSTSINNSQQKELKEILYVVKSNWKMLIGTAGSWFLLDVVFYANGIFSSTILKMYGDTSVHATSLASIWLSLLALPGY